MKNFLSSTGRDVCIPTVRLLWRQRNLSAVDVLFRGRRGRLVLRMETFRQQSHRNARLSRVFRLSVLLEVSNTADHHGHLHVLDLQVRAGQVQRRLRVSGLGDSVRLVPGTLQYPTDSDLHRLSTVHTQTTGGGELYAQTATARIVDTGWASAKQIDGNGELGVVGEVTKVSEWRGWVSEVREQTSRLTWFSEMNTVLCSVSYPDNVQTSLTIIAIDSYQKLLISKRDSREDCGCHSPDRQWRPRSPLVKLKRQDRPDKWKGVQNRWSIFINLDSWLEFLDF